MANYNSLDYYTAAGQVAPTVVNPVLTTQGQTAAPPMSSNTPPILMSATAAPPMSSNTPPITATNTAPPMSTPLPPLAALATQTLPAINGQNYVATVAPGQGTAGQQFAPNQIVQDSMEAIMGRNSPYIQRARQRALDVAAQRGMLNSTIAQGAAEGAAIDAAMPLVQEALGITNRREQQAFQSQESALNRTQDVNNALLASELGLRQMSYDYNFRNQLQNNQTLQQDWLNNQSFSREFNGTLAMMPIRNAFDLASMVQQYALEEPEVYTPTVISGMTNFFQQNMLSILQQYFPNLYGARPSGGTP